ncbi:MAG: ribulokinase [Hungatella sp.]|nr:ribulokinase [Hungatella sp.]
MRNYALGLDFGSLSGRAVLLDMENGEMAGEEVMDYPHGVLKGPPGAEPPDGEWVLQCPEDYRKVLYHIVPELLKKTGILGEQVAGIGVGFTASTVVPLKEFRPLNEDPRFALRPHAWTKMWKHHGAYRQARHLTELCRKHNLPYPDWYGGRISSECLMAKVLQVFEEDREVYEETDCFMEAADYITSLLVGKPVFGASLGTAKALWSRETGYPENSLFAAWSPELKNLPEKLMEHFPGQKPVLPGTKAGGLCKAMAERLGLKEGTSVSAPQMDAYNAVPGLGITEPGTMLLMVGTSTAVLFLDHKGICPMEGVTAALVDTCYEGMWTYATGQASVGDCFQWFIENCVPESYLRRTKEKNENLHTCLTELASRLRPGQTGLLALDWWGGSKSSPDILLSGMLLGLTMNTKPEHIYRALLESTAFGVRAIAESFACQNVITDRVVACGGIAVKNPFLMQMYADVLGRPIEVSTCTQAAAQGAAIYGAAAAEEGDAKKAAKRMGAKDMKIYVPDKERSQIYEKLYQEYKTLSEYFGKGGNKVMERLKVLTQS